MTAYYNEHDPYAAQWLRNLIAEGVIAAGEVDERSIVDVRADDIRGFTQCHFFAGIGGWSYALRLAGWHDDAPIWTGSCPCQPFSAAGQRKGTADERHLWPAFYNLIRKCAPPIVVGEQVASGDALGWFDIVSADMEASGYAVGAIDLSAACVGAPHIRQRLFWVADSTVQGLPDRDGQSGNDSEVQLERLCSIGGVANSMPTRRPEGRAIARRGSAAGSSELGGVAVPNGSRRAPGWVAAQTNGHRSAIVADGRDPRARPTDGFWRDADWLFCRDGKWRPVEPGTFPLANGISVDMGWDGPGENPYRQAPPSRVGMLRGYGNATVPELAATFMRAVMGAGE